MVVVSRRKGTLRSLVAKLLILGDKQTGKSASIVRYTTGRFIEQYSESTSDWLYRHSLGFDAKRNVTTLVELIEQKDIQICNSSNFFASSTSNLSQIGNGNQQNSLSSRVALDLQADLEMHCKQQLLNKLHWANAYIVIYAINDMNSFNKAIKYLNLIANNINSPSDNKTCGNGNTSLCSNANTGGNNNSNGFLNRLSPAAFAGSTNLTTPTSRQGSPMTSGSAGANINNCNCVVGGSSFNLNSNNSSSSLSSCPATVANAHNNIRRPILLLGNKRDLEKSGRQVNAQDGRLLAMRHQSMFAEVSIAESEKLIEIVLANLIEQIDPACLQVEHLSPQQQAASFAALQQIVRWTPTIELALTQKHGFSPLSSAPATSGSNVGPPVWASLVKSQVPIGSAVIQINRLETADVRLIKKPSFNSTSAVAASICQPVDRFSSAKTITRAVAAPRRLISCSRELVGAPEITEHQVANSSVSSAIKVKLQTCHKLAALTSNSSAYQNLKTSFRRASMAIIGSKTLSRGAKSATATSVAPKGQKYDCETINSSNYFAERVPFREKQCNSARDSIGECSDLIAPDQHRQSTLSLAQATSSPSENWLRNHVRLGRVDKTDNSCRSSCSDLKMMKPMTAATMDFDSERTTPMHHHQMKQRQTDGLHTESRFKPLFKYKSRRKTVAFDKVVKGSSCEGSLSATSQTDSGLCNSLLRKTTAFYKHGSEDSTNSMTSTITTATMPMTSASCNTSYDSTRCNSNRSSSSLSTMDAFYPSQSQFCDAIWNTERADSSSASVGSSNNSKEGGSARGCTSSGVRCVVTRSV